jgi:hypothetical protein
MPSVIDFIQSRREVMLVSCLEAELGANRA